MNEKQGAVVRGLNLIKYKFLESKILNSNFLKEFFKKLPETV